jgi:hypothetical protein
MSTNDIIAVAKCLTLDALLSAGHSVGAAKIDAISTIGTRFPVPAKTPGRLQVQ